MSGTARQNGYYGPCRGGPYDGKNLHHGLPVIAIAILNGIKTISYVENSPMPVKEIEHGHYKFGDDEIWHWSPPPSGSRWDR